MKIRHYLPLPYTLLWALITIKTILGLQNREEPSSAEFAGIAGQLSDCRILPCNVRERNGHSTTIHFTALIKCLQTTALNHAAVGCTPV